MSVRVLVVDDHSGFRAAARTALELEGFEVVAEAGDGASALELARLVEPDLVVLDVALPDASGFDLAERLAGGHAKVILVSSREYRDVGRRLDRSGALGFLSKDRFSGAAVGALLEAGR